MSITRHPNARKIRGDFGFRISPAPAIAIGGPGDFGGVRFNPQSAIRNPQLALTLVELLVAMAILVMVSAATMLMLRGITRAWRTGELRTERYQQARLLFDLFQHELTSAMPDVRYPFIGNKAGDTPVLVEGSVSDTACFVGALPGRDGLVERCYWLNNNNDLMCHDKEPADGNYATGASEFCAHDVMQFELSYFDGNSWLERWDGRSGGFQAGRLPKAIRVLLKIGRRNPEEFEAVVYVPTS